MQGHINFAKKKKMEKINNKCKLFITKSKMDGSVKFNSLPAKYFAHIRHQIAK